MSKQVFRIMLHNEASSEYGVVGYALSLEEVHEMCKRHVLRIDKTMDTNRVQFPYSVHENRWFISVPQSTFIYRISIAGELNELFPVEMKGVINHDPR